MEVRGILTGCDGAMWAKWGYLGAKKIDVDQLSHSATAETCYR